MSHLPFRKGYLILMWLSKIALRGLSPLLLLLFLSCAPSIKDGISLPFSIHDTDPIKKAAIINSIEERNRTIEDDPKWIKRSYEVFMIKGLHEIDEKDYPSYRRFLDNGSLYIIVHPAYYTFFQRPPLPISDDVSTFETAFSSVVTPLPKENELERLLREKNFSPKTALIKAQEKSLRDFLEYASTTKRLVILVLPGGYKNHAGYKFKALRDEFRRYINEVTNESESVIYIYSSRPNRGVLTERERVRLLRFLSAIKPGRILLGGGYLGRCLEDFWRTLEPFYSERLYLVPELIAISPSDISFFTAKSILRSDGTVDIKRLTKNIRENNIGNQEIHPRLRSINNNE